jgi:hypothetical protein
VGDGNNPAIFSFDTTKEEAKVSEKEEKDEKKASTDLPCLACVDALRRQLPHAHIRCGTAQPLVAACCYPTRRAATCAYCDAWTCLYFMP